MNESRTSDPAECNVFMRLFYSDWRPTFLGRWINQLNCWWSGLGLPPRFQAALEVRGRVSGRIRSNPVVIATVEGKDYLVSMLGPNSDWVKNVEASHGDAVIRQGRRRLVRLVRVPPERRAPIIREYIRIATSGRRHFPLPVGAPLSDFEAIADRYPVYWIGEYRELSNGSKQTHNPPVRRHVDLVSGRNLRQAWHCHHLAAYRDNKLSPGKEPYFPDRYYMMLWYPFPIGVG
jgi:hypothetical protein